MRKKIIDVLFVLIVVISSCATLNIYTSILDEHRENEEALVGVLTDNETLDLSSIREEYGNEDIMGKITIPGTSINTLFAQGEDNAYYLRHTLKKDYNRLGSIFLDSRVDLNDSQINLYAHNSIIYDNAPFRGLTDYVDPEFAEGNDIVLLETEAFSRKYQIVSVKQTNDQEHMALKSKNFDKHIKTIRENTIYNNREIQIHESDNILVLQTCAMNEKKEIIVILAKEII